MIIDEFKLIHVSGKFQVKYPYQLFKLSYVNSQFKGIYRLVKQFSNKEAALDYITRYKSSN